MRRGVPVMRTYKFRSHSLVAVEMNGAREYPSFVALYFPECGHWHEGVGRFPVIGIMRCNECHNHGP